MDEMIIFTAYLMNVIIRL